MRVEITGGEIVIDAEVLAPLLNVAAVDVPELMRRHAITSICERGVDAHEGNYRLSFFYLNRRVHLRVAPTGQSCNARRSISARENCRRSCTSPAHS